MSSCISGGGGGRAAYRLDTLDLEMIKSPHTTTTSWISNSSSPSSTLSESSNCPPLAIATRKPRTPRKRPNQTYNEAAAILSTAYPKIFPTKHLTNKPCKFTKKPLEKNNSSPFSFEPSDALLVPYRVIDDSGFLLNPQRPDFSIEPKGFSSFEKPCLSPCEINSLVNNISDMCDEYNNNNDQEHDFDAESILDEEIGEGIDCIMGDLGVEQNEPVEDFSSYYNNNNNNNTMMQVDNGFCYGYPVVGLGYDHFGGGMRKEIRAIRNGDEGDDWWRFPRVNVVDLTPRAVGRNVVSEKKKKKVVEIKNLEPKNEKFKGDDSEELSVVAKPNGGLLLKLNYDTVLNEWSDKASPFSGDSPVAELAGNDVQARLAQIDLFSENGGIREASVQRYKEKRRTRLFSKKIRYQVRKVNADRRPRMKGRFVRTPNED